MSEATVSWNFSDYLLIGCLTIIWTGLNNCGTPSTYLHQFILPALFKYYILHFALKEAHNSFMRFSLPQILAYTSSSLSFQTSFVLCTSNIVHEQDETRTSEEMDESLPKLTSFENTKYLGGLQLAPIAPRGWMGVNFVTFYNLKKLTSIYF